MSSRGEPTAVHPELDEEAVAEYLQAHPDFFERHMQLLSVLRLSHPVQGAVSLVERQLTLLRRRNRELEHQLAELVSVARDNERLSSRLHHLTLGLLQADSVDAVVATAREQLIEEFRADHAMMRLFAADEGDRARDSALFDDLFRTMRPACGQLPEAQHTYLFGDDTARIGSAVVVPLAEATRLGVLALGSHEPNRFHSGMGTLFLGYLGELVSRALTRVADRG